MSNRTACLDAWERYQTVDPPAAKSVPWRDVAAASATDGKDIKYGHEKRSQRELSVLHRRLCTCLDVLIMCYCLGKASMFGSAQLVYQDNCEPKWRKRDEMEGNRSKLRASLLFGIFMAHNDALSVIRSAIPQESVRI